MSNVFVIIKMCYMHNQRYDISCATLYFVGVILALALSSTSVLVLRCAGVLTSQISDNN